MVVIPIKKHEKELLQRQLDNEKAILKDLEATYKKALEDIDEKLAALLGRQDADLQHVIYQAERQKALRTQVQGILEQLQANEFESISEYLETCYEEGYLGAMYSLQKQGVPLMLPIDQEQVVAAIQTESKISEGLYTRLGKDVKELRKTISSEISRGIATAMPYADIARNIENASTIGLNRAKRIARTEGGRIQNKAAMDTIIKAKAIGADVVKKWSAALDGRTRPSHRRVDGEVREVDERFSNGLLYPHEPSARASEVVNCRCKLQEVARWALDDEDTKMLGRTEDMTDEDLRPIADKLNIPVSELRKYSGQIIPVKAKNYDDFKRQYDKLWHYEGSDLQKEADARIASYKKSKNVTNPLEKSSKSSTIKARNMSDVATGGKRNEEPLSDAQIVKAKEAAKKQGYKGEILYSEYSNTSFHGSTEGEAFHYMVIGTDAFPVEDNGGTANELISLDGCMAHEVVGHFEAWLKGTTQSVDVLEEAQASIRASKFGVGLSKEERQILYKDAVDRLNHAGILLDDVIDSLDVWER